MTDEHDEVEGLTPEGVFAAEYVCEACKAGIDMTSVMQCGACSRDLCPGCRGSHECTEFDDWEW